MRATIKNYLDAAKQRREETGESGFSLIELIVVVAILGILVAIAIPVFGGIQAKAEENALKTVAANAATQIAAAHAANNNATTVDLTNLAKDSIGLVAAGTGFTTAANVVTLAPATIDMDTLCVTASKGTTTPQKSGPGCTP